VVTLPRFVRTNSGWKKMVGTELNPGVVGFARCEKNEKQKIVTIECAQAAFRSGVFYRLATLLSGHRELGKAISENEVWLQLFDNAKGKGGSWVADRFCAETRKRESVFRFRHWIILEQVSDAGVYKREFIVALRKKKELAEFAREVAQRYSTDFKTRASCSFYGKTATIRYVLAYFFEE
jgi:hypothetical protein